MDWDDLRYFLAVARKGSIRGAAETLAVNHSTVSRRISNFEKKLGVRLFERLPTGYSLTTAGTEILGSAKRIEEEVGNLDRKVTGRDTRLNGVLRVTMPGPMATHVLMPDLATFSQIYPSIKLELAISYEEFDLKKREADVAIRVTSNPPDYLVGRKVARAAKAVYASNRYLEQHKPGGDLQQMTWLGWIEKNAYPDWVKQSRLPDASVYHELDDPYAQLAAAREGMGLAILPCVMGDAEPELSRVFPEENTSFGDVWILTHKDLRETARVRTFINYMVNALEQHRGLLEGNHLLQRKRIWPMGRV